MRNAEDNGFRETPFGSMPEEWGIKPLSECAQVQTGVAKGRKLKPAEAVTVPYLRVANVQDGFLDLSEIKYIDIRRSELNRFSLQAGDVLLTEGGDFDKLGRGFIWNAEVPVCVHQNHIFAVRPSKNLLLPEFLAYLTQSSYGKAYFLLVAHKTTNLACINTTKLKAFPALIPPLDEQHAIAHVLRRVQRSKDATEKLIAAARKLKRSLMRHLFTYGPVAVEQADQVPLKETETGIVPEHWEVRSFENMATLQRGQDLPRYDFKEGTIPVIGATSVIGYHDISNVRGPGVTVVRSGSSAGLPLYVEHDFWAHNVVLYVKNFHGNDVKFVYYRILSLQLTRFRAGVAVPTLNRNAFKNLKVALPPKKEQEQIVGLLDSVDVVIRQRENKWNALDTLFRTLLHHLMTGKVRVNELEFPATKEGSP